MTTVSNLSKFNGWSNRATWLVALWLNNDPVPQEHLYKIANYTNTLGVEKDQLIRDYTNELIDSIDLDCDKFLGGFIADLANNTLCEVDWVEIIENAIDG